MAEATTCDVGVTLALFTLGREMTQDMERSPTKYATLLSNVTQQYGGRENIFFSFQLMTITNKPLEQHVTMDTDTDRLTTI